MVIAQALMSPEASEAALQRGLASGAAANPFLFEFYTAQGGQFIQPGHIGVVYASLRANLSLGESASLFMSGPDEIEDDSDLKSDAEFVIAAADGSTRELPFETDSDGTIRLGTYIEDVSISIPLARVEIGPGNECVLVSPISIQCNELVISTTRVSVEGPALADENINMVYLEADKLDNTSSPSSVHVRRGNVKVHAYWPGVRNYPWTRYASAPPPTKDPRVDEALRRLRQFVIAFRSYGRGGLARSARKIHSTRMLKGSGQFVLDILIRESIVRLEYPRYFLNPVRLADVTGATYADCAARHFGQRTIDFMQAALGATQS
jgi:hypothetical protein